MTLQEYVIDVHVHTNIITQKTNWWSFDELWEKLKLSKSLNPAFTVNPNFLLNPNLGY